MKNLIFLLLLSVFGFSVSAVAGGGAGLLLIPMLNQFLPAQNVASALSLGTSTSSLSRIWAFYPSIRWQVARRFLPTALLGAGIGAWMLHLVEALYLQFLVGCFLAANLPAIFFTKSKTKVDSLVLNPTCVRFLPCVGFVAGFFSGFTGAVGLLFNGFYRKLGLSKEEIVATRSINEVLLHFLKLALYAYFGLLTVDAIRIGSLVAVSAFFSAVLMRSLLPLIGEKPFHYLGLVSTVVAGLAMLGINGSQIILRHEVRIYSDGLNGFTLYASLGQQRYTFQGSWSKGILLESSSLGNFALKNWGTSLKLNEIFYFGSDSYETTEFSDLKNLLGNKYSLEVK